MNDELTARQRALRLRRAGRPVKDSGSALGRGKAWFPQVVAALPR